MGEKEGEMDNQTQCQKVIVEVLRDTIRENPEMSAIFDKMVYKDKILEAMAAEIYDKSFNKELNENG